MCSVLCVHADTGHAPQVLARYWKWLLMIILDLPPYLHLLWQRIRKRLQSLCRAATEDHCIVRDYDDCLSGLLQSSGCKVKSSPVSKWKIPDTDAIMKQPVDGRVLGCLGLTESLFSRDIYQVRGQI